MTKKHQFPEIDFTKRIPEGTSWEVVINRTTYKVTFH